MVFNGEYWISRVNSLPSDNFLADKIHSIETSTITTIVGGHQIHQGEPPSLEFSSKLIKVDLYYLSL